MDALFAWLSEYAETNDLHQWIAAVAIVAITAIAERVATAIIRRAMSHDGVILPSSSIFLNIARVGIWLCGLSVMLSTCFGIDVNAIVAALGVGGIAISLGFSDTISNLIGGLQVSLTGIIAPGDNIRVGSYTGVVQDVTWRQTVIKHLDGHLIVIPNSAINSTTLEKLDPAGVARIPISVATDGRDLDEAARAIEEAALMAASSVGKVVLEPYVFYTAVTEFGVSATLKFGMESPGHVTEATSAILRAIAPYTRLPFREVATEPASETIAEGAGERE